MLSKKNFFDDSIPKQKMRHLNHGVYNKFIDPFLKETERDGRIKHTPEVNKAKTTERKLTRRLKFQCNLT